MFVTLPFVRPEKSQRREHRVPGVGVYFFPFSLISQEVDTSGRLTKSSNVVTDGDQPVAAVLTSETPRVPARGSKNSVARDRSNSKQESNGQSKQKHPLYF